MFADGFKSRYTTIPFAFSKHIANDLVFSLFTHHHREIEIIAMYDGDADFYSGSTHHALKTGDVLIIPPYTVHRAIVPAGTSYDCICFDLSLLWDKELREGLESGALVARGHLSADVPYTPDINRCTREAIKACERGEPGWEMEVIGLLSILFGRLKAESFFEKPYTPLKENEFEKSVIKYIEKHFSEQITSASAANEFYFNNSYFCRLFKNSFGCCFSDYLLEYRIAKAKFFLNTTNLSVSEIAIKSGFNSFSYFSKVFKNTVGHSPTEYRRRKRK